MEVAKLELTQNVVATTRLIKEDAAPVEVVEVEGSREVAVGVVVGEVAVEVAEVEATALEGAEAEAEAEVVEAEAVDTEAGAGVMPR